MSKKLRLLGFILGASYTIFKSKMKSRRQGGSDANVRGLYVEELTTRPTQIAL